MAFKTLTEDLNVKEDDACLCIDYSKAQTISKMDELQATADAFESDEACLCVFIFSIAFTLTPFLNQDIFHYRGVKIAKYPGHGDYYGQFSMFTEGTVINFAEYCTRLCSKANVLCFLH